MSAAVYVVAYPSELDAYNNICICPLLRTATWAASAHDRHSCKYECGWLASMRCAIKAIGKSQQITPFSYKITPGKK